MTPKVTSPDDAEWQARSIVNGTAKSAVTGKYEPVSGQWSTRFAGHPWVRQAELEGWARELRQAVIHAAKIRILAGQPTEPIERLMPDGKWVENTRAQAAEYAAGAAWRETAIEQAGSVDGYLKTVRPA